MHYSDLTWQEMWSQQKSGVSRPEAVTHSPQEGFAGEW